ncbi:hypothetical protein ACFYXH_25500 [Streptomyces sp. NPDC002730]
MEFKVPIIITSLGARADLNVAVHSWGGISLRDASATGSRARRWQSARTA